MKIKQKEIGLEKDNRFCALDPGIRSFQTVYSEEEIIQFQIKKETIRKLQLKIDKFKSLRSRKRIRKHRLKRREKKIYFQMTNLIDELHYKVINYLTNKYTLIILPSFESQKMTKNKIGINRSLLQLKHYTFKQRLKDKCEEKRCHFYSCTEEYTSKTCTRCGSLKEIKGLEVYKCENCKLMINRDVNGARNIAIKILKEMKCCFS